MPCTLDASKSANGMGPLCTDSDNHQARCAPPGATAGAFQSVVGIASVAPCKRWRSIPSCKATAQRVTHAPAARARTVRPLL
jgi:hypothetical protein